MKKKRYGEGQFDMYKLVEKTKKRKEKKKQLRFSTAFKKQKDENQTVHR